MPGNKLYRFSRIMDTLKRWWYWGGIGRFKYALLLSDKYLVEANVLFEYNQYLLAEDALERSNKFFLLIPEAINAIRQKGIQSDPFIQLTDQSIAVHRQVLETLEKELPPRFTWRAEKTVPVTIRIDEHLEKSKAILRNVSISIRP